jgi:hypothetical protein
MAQVVVHLPSKCRTLSSNPSIKKRIGSEKNVSSCAKKMKLGLYLTSHTKINLYWITDLYLGGNHKTLRRKHSRKSS